MKLSEEQLEVRIHYTMSLVGGFFGAYALFNRLETFGSSQTSNMIYMVMNILGRNSDEKLSRFIAILIYMFGFVVTVVLPKYTKVNMHIFSIVCDMIAIFMVSLLPIDMDPVIALYPIFFVTAVQWNSFKSANGFVSATIFSTNNLRQTTTSLTEYILEGDREKLKKFKFYLGVLLCFHTGVVISYLSSKFFSVKGALICLIPLCVALVFVKNENKALQLLLSKHPLRAFNKQSYCDNLEQKAS